MDHGFAWTDVPNGKKFPKYFSDGAIPPSVEAESTTPNGIRTPNFAGRILTERYQAQWTKRLGIDA